MHVSRWNLPKAALRVALKLFVRGDQNQTMRQGLAGQHAVKWIAMQGRQLGQVQYGAFLQGQGADLVAFPLFGNETLWRDRQWEASQGVFDGNFPDRDAAKVYLIGRIAERLVRRG